MKKKTREVIIYYLGGELNLELAKGSRGEDLMKLFCQRLGVEEKCFFGIQYEDRKGKTKWIGNNEKLSRRALRRGPPLFFLARYLPEDASTIQDPVARRLLYEQAKKEILGMTVYCQPEMSVLLASYSLQAENGDWDRVDYSKISLGELIPRNVKYRYRTREELWRESVGMWHRDHLGMSADEARAEYLKVAQSLPAYGVHYFPVRWLFRETWLGVTARGVHIYDNTDILVPKTTLRWIFIKTVRFSGKKLIVRPIFAKLADYVFLTRSARISKQIFELCVGYHNIYVRKLRRQEGGEVDAAVRTETGKTVAAASEDSDEAYSRRQFRSESIYIEKLPTLEEEKESI